MLTAMGIRCKLAAELTVNNLIWMQSSWQVNTVTYSTVAPSKHWHRSRFSITTDWQLKSHAASTVTRWTHSSTSCMALFPAKQHSTSEPPRKEVWFTHASINPLKPELNPICYLLALLAHHFLHVSRIRVKSLTIRLLMSYIYIWSTYSWCF